MIFSTKPAIFTINYADETDVWANSAENPQKEVDTFPEARDSLWLTLNPNKTKIVFNPAAKQTSFMPSIQVHGASFISHTWEDIFRRGWYRWWNTDYNVRAQRQWIIAPSDQISNYRSTTLLFFPHFFMELKNGHHKDDTLALNNITYAIYKVYSDLEDCARNNCVLDEGRRQPSSCNYSCNESAMYCVFCNDVSLARFIHGAEPWYKIKRRIHLCKGVLKYTMKRRDVNSNIQVSEAISHTKWWSLTQIGTQSFKDNIPKT